MRGFFPIFLEVGNIILLASKITIYLGYKQFFLLFFYFCKKFKCVPIISLKLIFRSEKIIFLLESYLLSGHIFFNKNSILL